MRYWYPATPEPASIEPAAVTVSEAVCCQPARAPARVGAVGPVESIMAVFAAPVTAGAHADALPAVSTARIWTNVCPGAVTSSDPPAAAALHADPSGEVRCS